RTPPNIRQLLKQCLRKNPEERLAGIAEAEKAIESVQRGRRHWWAVGGAATLAGAGNGGGLWVRGPSSPLGRSAWGQRANFTHSAAQPSLSADERMVAFIRGPRTFVSSGQVYVKMLPDGEPVRLTNDNLPKMSPAFSPDGARIAYTVRTPSFDWDTWWVS